MGGLCVAGMSQVVPFSGTCSAIPHFLNSAASCLRLLRGCRPTGCPTLRECAPLPPPPSRSALRAALARRRPTLINVTLDPMAGVESGNVHAFNAPKS